MTPTLADLPGLWRRQVLTAPGIEDRDTRVYWFQGASLFADLRVPAGLPGTEGARCLADLGPQGLASLARCEGFAGETDVQAGICRWTRRINYQGPERGADVGALRWGGSRDELIEEGVEADYGEVWQRVGTGTPAARVYSGPDGQRAWLVWSDRWFLLARADPAAMSGAPLVEARAAGGDPWPRLDMEFALGRWDRRLGIVELSTQPWRVGTAILARPQDAGALELTRMTPVGTGLAETWQPDPPA